MSRTSFSPRRLWPHLLLLPVLLLQLLPAPNSSGLAATEAAHTQCTSDEWNGGCAIVHSKRVHVSVVVTYEEQQEESARLAGAAAAMRGEGVVIGGRLESADFDERSGVDGVHTLTPAHTPFLLQTESGGGGAREKRVVEHLQEVLVYEVDCKELQLECMPRRFESDVERNRTYDLNFRSNRLTNLSFATLGGFAQLERLDLSSNRIAHVTPDAFTSAPLLERLDLSRNLLAAVPVAALAPLTRLQHLDLSFNPRITAIPNDAFATLGSLTSLKLRSCSIATVEPRALLRLPRAPSSSPASSAPPPLANLDLSGNRVRTLDALLVEQLASAAQVGDRALRLGENPWHCDCRLRALRLALGGLVAGTPAPNCSSPTRLAGRLWSRLDASEFACPPEVHPLPEARGLSSAAGGVGQTPAAASVAQVREVVIFEEENATLKLLVYSDPDARLIAWTRNGLELNESAFKYNTPSEPHPDPRRRYFWKYEALRLSGASLADEGNYSILVQNAAGSASGSVYLRVLPRPTTTPSPTTPTTSPSENPLISNGGTSGGYLEHMFGSRVGDQAAGGGGGGTLALVSNALGVPPRVVLLFAIITVFLLLVALLLVVSAALYWRTRREQNNPRHLKAGYDKCGGGGRKRGRQKQESRVHEHNASQRSMPDANGSYQQYPLQPLQSHTPMQQTRLNCASARMLNSADSELVLYNAAAAATGRQVSSDQNALEAPDELLDEDAGRVITPFDLLERQCPEMQVSGAIPLRLTPNPLQHLNALSSTHTLPSAHTAFVNASNNMYQNYHSIGGAMAVAIPSVVTGGGGNGCSCDACSCAAAAAGYSCECHSPPLPPPPAYLTMGSAQPLSMSGSCAPAVSPLTAYYNAAAARVACCEQSTPRHRTAQQAQQQQPQTHQHFHHQQQHAYLSCHATPAHSYYGSPVPLYFSPPGTTSRMHPLTSVHEGSPMSAACAINSNFDASSGVSGGASGHSGVAIAAGFVELCGDAYASSEEQSQHTLLTPASLQLQRSLRPLSSPSPISEDVRLGLGAGGMGLATFGTFCGGGGSGSSSNPAGDSSGLNSGALTPLALTGASQRRLLPTGSASSTGCRRQQQQQLLLLQQQQNAEALATSHSNGSSGSSANNAPSTDPV